MKRTLPSQQTRHRLLLTLCCQITLSLGSIPGNGELISVGPDGRGGRIKLVRSHAHISILESEVDEYEFDMKVGHRYYPEEMYTDEDGQLSWFKAGVRVGVGIGVGPCLGVSDKLFRVKCHL